MHGVEKSAASPEQGLVGHWPLRGDAQDRSGLGNHGTPFGKGSEQGEFDGRESWIEVPSSDSLRFGTGDFTLAAWVWTAPDIDDVIGDVLTKYDAQRRRGFNLTIKSTAGGYNSHGDDRHVYFGIDDGSEPTWEDCGRPSKTSNYVSNSLTVFNGNLYAAITDAEREEDWCHVFRYLGGQNWQDCGRVGNRRTHGVGPMLVHRGSLYAATWTYDWTRVGRNEPLDDFCCVYRYAGGTSWEDCGQPGNCRRLFGLASYRGQIYVAAEDGRCYVYDGDRTWTESGRFPNYAHPLGIHDGKLYAGVLNPAGVWEFDGKDWVERGNPQRSEDRCNQIHALEVHQRHLLATTWPEGHVCRREANGEWTDLGRLGDAMEINALVVHNGQLYGGTIPRAEVFRFDGGERWTSIRRFLDPAGYEFKDSNEWARVTSLTVYAGKVFASMGSCTSSRLDAPADFRGQVYAMQTGPCVSYDRDLGALWQHVAAVKRGNRLELFVNGEKTGESSEYDAGRFDVNVEQPLLIGLGETDCFSGRIRDVRAYRLALEAAAIRQLVR